MCNLKASQHFSIFQDVSYFVLERSEVVAHFVLHIVYFVHSVFFRGAMDGSASPGDQGAKPYSPLPHPLPSPFKFQAEGPRPKRYQATENARNVR